MPVSFILPTLAPTARNAVSAFGAAAVPVVAGSGLLSGSAASFTLPTLAPTAGGTATPTFIDVALALLTGRLCPPQYIVPLTGQRPIGVRVAPNGTP